MMTISSTLTQDTDHFVACNDNYLELNVNKMKDMIVMKNLVIFYNILIKREVIRRADSCRHL